MKDRQREALRKEILNSVDSSNNSEFLNSELDTTLLDTTLSNGLTIRKYSLNDKEFKCLKNKMQLEFVGYLIRIIILLGILSLALFITYKINSVVFRVTCFTVFTLVIIATSNKEVLNNVLQKVSFNNAKFLTKDTESFIGIVTNKLSLDDGVTAVYFGDRYLLIRDAYSLLSFNKDDVVIVLYNSILDEYKIRDVEDTFKIRVV